MEALFNQCSPIKRKTLSMAITVDELKEVRNSVQMYQFWMDAAKVHLSDRQIDRAIVCVNNADKALLQLRTAK